MENKTFPAKGKKKDPNSSYIVINGCYLSKEKPKEMFGIVLESFSPYIGYSSKPALIKLYINCLKLLEDYCNLPEIITVYKREGRAFIKSIQGKLIYVNALKKKKGDILKVQNLFFNEILKSEGHTVYMKDRYINPPWNIKQAPPVNRDRNLIRIVIKSM